MLTKGEKKIYITNGILSGNPRLLLLYWNGIFKFEMLFLIEKGKSEYKEEMIHKFQTVRLSFLEFQSLVYNELNNNQKLLCSALFLTCTYFQFSTLSEHCMDLGIFT